MLTQHCWVPKEVYGSLNELKLLMKVFSIFHWMPVILNDFFRSHPSSKPKSSAICNSLFINYYIILTKMDFLGYRKKLNNKKSIKLQLERHTWSLLGTPPLNFTWDLCIKYVPERIWIANHNFYQKTFLTAAPSMTSVLDTAL